MESKPENLVSACLITYRRPENIGPIVTHLLQQPFIGEVLIRDQEKEENLKCFGRYQLAERASHEIIFTQDDDCIVEDIRLIYESFLREPDRLAFGLAPSHWPLWEDGRFTYIPAEGRHSPAELAMLGWGAFFRKDRIRPAFNRYARETLKPTDSDSFYREADRIFSLMLGQKHIRVSTPNLKHLSGASGDSAMWKEEEHFRSRDMVIQKCLQILRGENNVERTSEL